MPALKDLPKPERDSHVDRMLDSAIKMGLDSKQPPELISFIDRVVRPGMKWINDMEADGADADQTWAAMASGMANLIGEMTLRLNRRDDVEGGVELGQRIVNNLAQALAAHIQMNFHPTKSN